MRSKYTLSLSTMAPIESELTEYLESLEKGHHRSGEIRRLILYGFVRLINNKSKEEATFDSLDDSSKNALLEILDNKSFEKVVEKNVKDDSFKNQMNRVIAENELLKKNISDMNKSKNEISKDNTIEDKVINTNSTETKVPETKFTEDGLAETKVNESNEVKKEEINPKDLIKENLKYDDLNSVEGEQEFYFEDPNVDIDLDEDIKDPLSLL